MNERKTENKLDVYFRDILVGHLWLDEHRHFVFRYNAGWLKQKGAIPLSLSLPFREEPFIDDRARFFFTNLLPEAEIRKMIARQLGISEQNDFVLLREIGGDCAGAVSLLPEGVLPLEKPGYRELDEDELHKIITELPRRPFLVGERGVRLSLAGAQNKLPIYMEGAKIFIATENAPSSHILKPPIQGLDETVDNEAFCMMLAARMGLSVPMVAIRQGRDRLYIVERFDRQKNQDGKILRLHQEDFCQALNIPPDQKYESEGGPSLALCFALLKEASVAPAADQKALLSWVIFNFLIGNADAHAKNLAIIYTAQGPRLAPFYDLIGTRVYPDITEKFAMRIGGENRPDWIQPRHWERFSEDVNIRPRLVLQILKDMGRNILPQAEDVAKEFYDKFGKAAIIGKILEGIKKIASGTTR